MKLIAARLKRLEAAAAEEEERPAVTGMVWSSAESVVDASALEPGEYVACDCYVEAWPDPATPDDVIRWRVVERVTRDAEDYGVVYGADGAAVGRVVYLRGKLLRVEWTAGPLAAGA